MDSKKARKADEVTIANAMKKMFKVLEDKDTIYLAISKRDFKVLIYVLGVGIIANIALVDLLLSAPTRVDKAPIYIYSVQLAVSAASIIAGLWLFLKGINIVVDDKGFQ